MILFLLWGGGAFGAARIPVGRRSAQVRASGSCVSVEKITTMLVVQQRSATDAFRTTRSQLWVGAAYAYRSHLFVLTNTENHRLPGSRQGAVGGPALSSLEIL